MKYIIAESRLENIIFDYLDSNYTPSYVWGPELHDYCKRYVEQNGYQDFLVDGRVLFSYTGKHESRPELSNTLYIGKFISERLNELFGPMWKPSFVKWFRKNTGLDIARVNSKY